MKYFIYRLSTFLIIACIPFYLIGHSVRRKYINPNNIKDLGDSIKIIALGDSHIRYGINDKITRSLILNQGSDGEHIFYTFCKTKLFIENNHQIKAVILSFNPFLLGEWRKIAITGKQGDIFHPRYFSLIQNYPDLNNNFKELIPFKDYMNVWLTINFGLPSKKLINDFFQNKETNESFWGEYIPLYESHIGRANLQSKIKQHYGDFDENKPHSYIGKNELKFFYELLDYLSNKNIQIILCNTPCHKLYNELVPDFITHYMDSIATDVVQKYDAQYLNYQCKELPDSCFSDYDHLNAYGAEWFTKEILTQIDL